MVCKFCRTVVFSGTDSWGFHRRTYVALDLAEEADIGGCIICSTLRRDVAEAVETGSPLYRWTIRKPPHIRESGQFITLTLRPTSPLYANRLVKWKAHARDALPTRTFHLFSGSFQTVQDLGDGTNSLEAWRQIRAWLQECESHHPLCAPAVAADSPRFVPTRLVDVSGDRIYVAETKSQSFKKERYITLSHCWGDKKGILQLTGANTQRLMDPTAGIEWDELPLNFQHAIVVARNLGIRYIWIDSLCIAQDTGEFKTEGQLMHYVYRNSFCNIAAADSSNGSGGLFRQRDPQHAVPEVVDIDGTTELLGSWSLLPEDLWSEQLLNHTLYSRGWVFQERLLSPRILHFSSTQIFWDCATISACEAIPRGLPFPLDGVAATDRHWRERLLLKTKSSAPTASNDDDPMQFRPLRRATTVVGTADDSLEAFWKKSVRDYTRCELTDYEHDRLAAIWGVAKLVRDSLGEEYGAGLWEHELHEQLAWRVVNFRTSSRPPELAHNPSWSWASVIGEIDVQERFIHEDRFRIIRDHENDAISFELDISKAANRDLQPNIIRHELEVRGTIVAGQWRGMSRPGDSHESWDVRLNGMQHLSDKELASKFDYFPDVLQMQDGDDCFVLVLASSQSVPKSQSGRQNGESGAASFSGIGLVLDRVGSSTLPRNYRRIGAFHFRGLTKEEYKILDGGLEQDFWLE